MEKTPERRREQRLRYHWPIWFANDFGGSLTQGQLVDVCSGGAAFICHNHETIPQPGQEITARFSTPRFGQDDSFDIDSFTRVGQVRRVNEVNSFTSRIAMEFIEPLPFKPAEQPGNSRDRTKMLRASVI